MAWWRWRWNWFRKRSAARDKRLTDYLMHVSENQNERNKWIADRLRAIAESGLSDEHKEILRRGDHEEIRRAVHREEPSADVGAPMGGTVMVSNVVVSGPDVER